ncbi:hypothetical protein HDE76_001841 [Rhodanobacter sp. ANJX3]|uniref:hypothetical protein n=1 Tax=Rhodanobacter sp. ANJX3 TaxID=2723083 RepID=UPI00160B973C|nr:hypothetical protein [Rhodanobacter sp. ANJX3]MBB5358625.1 hypothetical protein [Rhodanobacter sp. ANJX3]
MASTVTHEAMIDPDLRKYVQRQGRLLNDRLPERLKQDKQARLLRADLEPELVVPIIVAKFRAIRPQDWFYAILRIYTVEAELYAPRLMRGNTRAVPIAQRAPRFCLKDGLFP